MTLRLLTENRSWNRWVLYFYWIMVVLILFTGELVHALNASSNGLSESPLIAEELSPLYMSLFALLLLAEILFRVMDRFFDYFLIGIGFAFGLVIMLTFGTSIEGLFVALDFPVVVSLFYFSREKLRFAGALTLGGYFFLYPFVDNLRDQITIYEIFALIGMIIGTSIVGLAILKRGQELLESLERAARSEIQAFAATVADESASKYDHLTGLYNHITFQEYMNSLAEQHVAYGMPLQLAIVDIDNFKSINDTFGHHLGDAVLQGIALLLKNHISSDDVATRYGGEEFALILTGKSQEQSRLLLDGIRESLAAIDYPALNHRQVTVSIGMADFGKGMTKDELFRLADEHLYRAKKNGKNQVVSAIGKGAEA